MANVKISQLPAVTSTVGTDEYVVNQAGVSKKVTGDQIHDFVRSGSRKTYLFEDWITGPGGNLNWTTCASGAGAAETVNTALVNTNHPGILEFTTGTTTSGRAGRSLGAANGTFISGFVIGGGPISQEWLVRVGDLSTAGEEYVFVVGNSEAPSAITSGIVFFYQRSVLGGNWHGMTRDLSVSTLTDTGIAVVADTWIKLRIEINAAATSVGFYINNVLVATNTTNIPLTIQAPVIRVVKSAGTTPRIFYCDYFKHTQIFTSER